MKGYTLVELLIVITIIGILISFGASAYGKLAERQNLRADTEKLVEVLQNSKKRAVIGDSDCSPEYGPLTSITVTLTSNSSNFTSQAICKSGVGTPSTTVLKSTKPTSSTTLIFRPLDGSLQTIVDLITITLDTGQLQKNVTINRSGIINYDNTQ